MDQESLIIYAALGIWLLICAWQDFTTKQVSNWLTLPAIGVTLISRLVSWLSTPWWIILTVSVLAFTLWKRGYMGGADAKGWILFGFFGMPVLVGAAMGQLVWYFAVNWGREKFQSQAVGTPIPGFPGYAIGLWIFGCYVVSFKLMGVFFNIV